VRSCCCNVPNVRAWSPRSRTSLYQNDGKNPGKLTSTRPRARSIHDAGGVGSHGLSVSLSNSSRNTLVRSPRNSPAVGRFTSPAHRPRVAIMVSRSGHCLADLLYRHHIGELPCEIPVVISNHEDQRELAGSTRSPSIRCAWQPTRKTKPSVEVLLTRSTTHRIGVLARYMQIMSQGSSAGTRTGSSTFHHSFLPCVRGSESHIIARSSGSELDRRHQPLRDRGAGRKGPSSSRTSPASPTETRSKT